MASSASTLIERRGFLVLRNGLDRGRCPSCSTLIPGFWDRDTAILIDEMAGTCSRAERAPEASR